jgi:hypothetical protein
MYTNNTNIISLVQNNKIFFGIDFGTNITSNLKTDIVICSLNVISVDCNDYVQDFTTDELYESESIDFKFIPKGIEQDESVVYFNNVIDYEAYLSADITKNYPDSFDNFTFLDNISNNIYIVSTFYGVSNGETIQMSQVVFNSTQIMRNGQGLVDIDANLLDFKFYKYLMIILIFLI